MYTAVPVILCMSVFIQQILLSNIQGKKCTITEEFFTYSPAYHLIQPNGVNWQGNRCAAVKYKLAETLMIDFSCSVQHSPMHFMKLQSPALFFKGNSSIMMNITSTDVT
jgi:hypothetical protein